jgi:MerR family transcriptional regulator, light-induced transcriptional regulator
MSTYDMARNVEPLSQHGLILLQREADQISREVTDQYFVTHPECITADPDRIRDMCKVDFAHHLSFLLSAMATSTIEIFSNYTLWLKDVLVSRGLSLQHPIDSFGMMKAAILDRLDAADQQIAGLALDAGIDVLKGAQSLPADYMQDTNKVMHEAAQLTLTLIAGNRAHAQALVKSSLDNGVALIDMEVDLMQPAMYQVGRLWQDNKISVAQEHLSTALSQNILALAFANAEFADPLGKKVLCACVEGNHHGLGLRMISDAFETSGWDACFLGTNTPNASILSQVDKEEPDVLALSVSLPHQILGLQVLLGQLHTEMAGKRPSVVVGGLAFNNHKTLSGALKVDQCYTDAKALYADLH